MTTTRGRWIVAAAAVLFVAGWGRAGVVAQAPPQVKQVPPSPTVGIAGMETYATYCAVCHASDGLGKGPISDKFPAIPPVAGSVRFSDAYLFGLITEGRGLMPGYARIPAQARWDVVNYLRTMFPPPTTAGSPAVTAP